MATVVKINSLFSNICSKHKLISRIKQSVRRSSGEAKSPPATEVKQQTWIQYFCSTQFWGPVANWGIPLAALADMKRDVTIISPNMTAALMVYSSLFMRFSLMVKPRNMLLFSCHFTNLSAQTVQLGRYMNHYYLKKEVQPASIEESGSEASTSAHV